MRAVPRQLFVMIITILGFVGGMVYANYQYVQENPGGNDFLVHWVGARSFIFKGQSPYSDETALEIQTMVYGGAAEKGQHELRVVYPLYSGILFAPFAMIDNYPLARAVWMTFLEIATLVIAIVSMGISRWKPKPWLIGITLVFSLFWYHGLRALINGNAVIVVTLLILWALWAIRKEQDAVAGFALAFATFKPHLVILIILCVFIWATSHRRWTLIGWTVGWVLFLVLLGIFFIPNWPLQNAWEIMRFSEYNPPLSLGKAFEEWWPGIGTQLRWGLTMVLAVVLVLEWRAVWGKDFNHLMWTTCLTMAAGQWIGIATDPGNFVLLFIPMILIFAIIKERWKKAGDWIVLGVMTVLFIGLWAIFLNTVAYGSQPQQSSILFVPMPLFSLTGLYWVRWWIIRPTRPILVSG